MEKYLDKLVSISSSALINNSSKIGILPIFDFQSKLHEELQSLLQYKNGFYAFESALHVFPSGKSDSTITIEGWNNEFSWRKAYQELTKNLLFFAQDIFGMQYAIKNHEIFFFNSESAQLSPFAKSLEEWAKKILEDYNFHTGYNIAQSWQKTNGPIPAGKRLAPKIPFITGGEFKLENLYLAEPKELMSFRGMMAQNIKNLPDGAKIKFTVK